MSQSTQETKPMADEAIADIVAKLMSDQEVWNKMQASAQSASLLLKSLAHPQRLMLLCQLTQGEYCVSELENLVNLQQPSLSQQLGVLRTEGIVTARREGRQIYYRIASDDALAVMQVLYERFCATQ